MMHSSSDPYAQGRSRFDFAVYDPAGRPLAQIEAKANPRATRSWAKQFWADLEEMERRPSAALFILVTPSWLFVWDVPKVKSGAPTRTIDAKGLLAPYFARAEIIPTEIHPDAFEMLVSWWLHDLASRGMKKQPPASLVRTGLLQALAEGKVVREAVG